MAPLTTEPQTRACAYGPHGKKEGIAAFLFSIRWDVATDIRAGGWFAIMKLKMRRLHVHCAHNGNGTLRLAYEQRTAVRVAEILRILVGCFKDVSTSPRQEYTATCGYIRVHTEVGRGAAGRTV